MTLWATKNGPRHIYKVLCSYVTNTSATIVVTFVGPGDCTQSLEVGSTGGTLSIRIAGEQAEVVTLPALSVVTISNIKGKYGN